MKTRIFMCALMGATFLSTPSFAQESCHEGHAGHVHKPAPIGIMGDHTHSKGQLMLSYRYMGMHMEGNRDGTKKLSPLEISGDYPNPTGSGPTTLRVVPTEMDMDMHMVGAMVGATDWLTLMLMGTYVEKRMKATTYAMMNPDLALGTFKTKTSGVGDTKVAGLFNILKTPGHNIVGQLGVSLPTGSTKERGVMLNPMGDFVNMRMGYGMQLGSGTYDLEPALTYSGNEGEWSWGAQYRSSWRLGQNNQGYSLGDKHNLSLWGRYDWGGLLGTSLRLGAEHEAKIDGRDTQIAGPMQMADPDNYGGRRLELGLGLDYRFKDGLLKGHRIAAEGNLPLYQDLNGPQMERDYSFTLGYKLRF